MTSIKDKEIRQSLFVDICNESLVNYDFFITMNKSSLKVDYSTARVVFHKYLVPNIIHLIEKGFIQSYKKYRIINVNDNWILKPLKRYPIGEYYYESLFLLFKEKLNNLRQQSNLFSYIEEDKSLYRLTEDRNELSQIEEMQLDYEDKFILENYETDLRKKSLKHIIVRQGQTEFRKKLIEIFEGKCSITQCEFLPILEAAHIVPYKGSHTNLLSNGLLLRADIHSLFDQGYIYIDYTDLKVHIARDLYKSSYENLHNYQVKDPIKNRIRISRNALKIHQDWAISLHKFD